MNLLNTSSKPSNISQRAITLPVPIPVSLHAIETGIDEGKIDDSDNDSSIVATLRKKLVDADATIRDLEDAKQRLSVSLSSREEEFNRLTKLNTDSEFLQMGPDSDNVSGTKMSDQSKAVNAANKRVIEQLNSQIDFLNEQLSLREDQIGRIADSTTELQSLRSEYEQL